MGIVSAIVALIKAFPSLEKLISESLDGYRKWAAEERRVQKHRDIDDAVDFFAKLPNGETGGGARDDQPPAVSGGSKGSAALDAGSAQEVGRHRSKN